MSIKNIRLEVMQFLENKVDEFVDQYLLPAEKIWQPTDFYLILKVIIFLKK